MDKSAMLRKLLVSPPAVRTSIFTKHMLCSTRSYSSIPSIAAPSFWTNLIPKPLRKSTNSKPATKIKNKEWNPATFFIVTFMLIGSMSVQMISLKNNFAAFSRRADAKIGLLQEIIGRIQKGEDVDVNGLLGTGDPKREKEWEEVLKEIEEEDLAWETSRKSKPESKSNMGTTYEENKPLELGPLQTKIEKREREEPKKVPRGFF